MYKKILFPTNFSESTRKTIDCIGDVPGVEEVILLHVVDATRPSVHGWTYDPQIEDAKLRLEEQREHLEDTGFIAKARVDVIKEGSVADTILKTAEDENVSLIVIDVHGNSLVKGLILGNVSTSVIRNTKTDVLVMRHKLIDTLEGEGLDKFCERIFFKAICPTDFSKPATDALSFVECMKEIGEIGLLHVVTEGDTEEEIEENIQIAKKKLEDIGDHLKNEGFIVQEHIRVGNPAEEICSLANDEDASIIIMSSHGRGWLEELLLGDTVFDVVKNTNRPVLVKRSERKI